MRAAEGADSAVAPLPDDLTLPIVFVHGFAGSAQQFQSQALRFAMNGYPQERLRAYEHDGAGMATDEFVAGVDAVIDEARSAYGTDQVYLIGHSRGTSVSTMYLSDPARAAKVAKYVSLDGAGCGDISVPCVAPAQTTNMRGVQTDPLPGQKHVEVATSKESFAVQFNFLFGRAPDVVDIVKQSGPVVVSGRAVNFPANSGREGTTLQFWEIDGATGMRVGSEPKATFELGASGDWGPVTVEPDKHYEQVLLSKNEAAPNQHHFYAQPFLRSTQFVRLLSGPPSSDSRTHTNIGDDHAAITTMRMREWTTDDKLEVSTHSAGGDQDARNVITQDITNNPITIYLHDDAATPAETTLAPLPWYPEQPFQNGVDLFMPGNETPAGSITLKNTPRGAEDKPQTIVVPNWASSKHVITVMFSDYPQE
jgi:pimeloyl-ACP methyl ester carboxylesterase